MLKKSSKILINLFFIFMILLNFTSVYADNGNFTWWSSAHTFFSGTNWSEDQTILADLKTLIKMIGNAVFLIITIVLGIKYMAASAEGKGDVKEGLTGLVVAIVLFYGWSALDTILTGEFKKWFGTDSPTETITTIYSVAVSILNYISIGVLLYVGVKYLFAGAEGKADLKGKGVPFVVGLVMTFATITFLNFLIKVVEDVLT